MSSKRQATTDLNHDNWDREEEPEERGTFRTATEDELKNRVIKKAKRKIAPCNDNTDGSSGTKSIFSGFSGFGKPPTSSETTSSSPFSFLNKIPAVAAATTAVSSSSATTTTNETKPQFSFGSGTAAATKVADNSSTAVAFKSTVDGVAPSENSLNPKVDRGNVDFSEYHKKLSSLNQAVCEWIKTHVDKNPVCILSPIFKDYEKYLKEIENDKTSIVKDGQSANYEKQNMPSGTDVGDFKFSVSTVNTSIPKTDSGISLKSNEVEIKTNGFSFSAQKTDSTSTKISGTSSFSFNIKPLATATTSSTTSSFSFGNSTQNLSQTTTPPKPFSFTPGSTPFSFGNIKPPEISAPSTLENEQNEEDEEPPKNEFKQVVEDDAVYSKKCKVFVKKDGNFVDKGVGTLYLKPIESTGKTQLLVRADTNLGNILVNLILNSAIPAQRMGKNNVMMVCMPTPDAERPTSMLLRVKTGEEADDLLENIEKYKK